jgi:hypothetical protein
MSSSAASRARNARAPPGRPPPAVAPISFFSSATPIAITGTAFLCRS